MVDTNDDISLLAALKGAKFEASLITTFNATLPFYEEVMLRRLQAAESRHNVVLMDAAQCARSWASHSLRPRLAGSAYALIPMTAPGAFHPKICLLASKKRCVVFIGSHNLTLSGFGFNREVTTCIEVRPDSAPADKLLLSQVWSLLQEWLRTQQALLAPSVLEAAQRIGEYLPTADPAESQHAPPLLLGQSISGPSLLDQLDQAIPAVPRRIVVTGAFFDTQHAFLKALETRWPDASIKVIIDPATVRLGSSPTGLRSQFVDARALWEKNADRYLHAKALLLEFGDSHMLIAGSANPSRPAWLGGARRNFEAMLVRPDLDVASSAFASDLALGFSAVAMDDTALRSIPITHQDDENDADASSAPVRIVALAAGTTAVVIPASDSAGFAQVIMHLQDGSYTAPACVERSEAGGAVVELGERASEVRWLEFSGRGDELLRVIVHHDAALDRSPARSHRAALQDALAGLDFSGANIELLIQQVEKAIFDDPDQVVLGPRGIAHPGAMAQASAASARPESLAVHDGEVVGTQKKQKKRLLQAGSLLDVLDALLYRLGHGLPRSASPGASTPQLSEEELVGTEHEDVSQELNAELTLQAVNAVRKRIKQVVGRMIKQLKAAQDETKPEARTAKTRTAVVQLVAVLSLVREFRRLRHQPVWRRMGGFIDSELRQELLSQSMIILFGRERGIAHEQPVHEFRINEAVELGQVRALLAWLAFDLGHSLLERIEPMATKVEKDDLILSHSYLYELLPAIVQDDEDVAQLTSSVRMTSAPLADENANDENWLTHHIETGMEVATAPATSYLDKEGIKAGDLIRVPRSSQPRFGIVVEVSTQEIRLSELGQERSFMRFAWLPPSRAHQALGN